VITLVAVEKVDFSENRLKMDDQKKSLKRILARCLLSTISREVSFSTVAPGGA
jgi:hypothetical protein